MTSFRANGYCRKDLELFPYVLRKHMNDSQALITNSCFNLQSDRIHIGPLTILKYAVEVVIPKSTCLHCVLEPIFERIVFEELSRNLFAIKNEVERQFRGNECGALRYMPDNMELDKPKLSGRWQVSFMFYIC